MATWTDVTNQCTNRVMNLPAETYTDKGGYLRFTATKIEISDGGTNQIRITWNITIQGTRWVALYGRYATLGGTAIVPKNTNGVSDWYTGQVIDSGVDIFDANNDGTSSIKVYVKQMFYYYYSDSRWANSYYYQENEQTIGIPTIPRYFSSTPTMQITEKTETSVTIAWTTPEKCSTVQYKIDNGNWIDVVADANGTSGSYTINGLTANTSYTIYGDFKRRDSNLWCPTKPYVPLTTYDYPKITGIGTYNLPIGNQQILHVYNPLGRCCTAYIRQNNISGALLGSIEGFEYGTGNYSFTPEANAMYNSIPTSQEGNCVYYIVSQNPSHTSTTISGKYKINGNEGPTFGSDKLINFIDTLHASDITGNNTKFIKGHNTLQGTIKPMTFNNSANSTNARYIITATGSPSSQEISYGLSNKNFNVSNLTTNLITITAYDSRGLPTAASKTIDLVDYTNPKVSSLTVTRQNGIGTYATIECSGTYTYFNWTNIVNHNSIQHVYYRQKLSTSSTWGSWIDITSSLTQNNNGQWTLTKTLDIVFTNTAKYDFQVYVQDLLESSDIQSTQLSTANALIWRDLNNKRIGINKKPDYSLDVAGNIKASERIYTDRQFINENQGSWIDDRNIATARNTSDGGSSAYAAAVSQKTKNGNWTIGSLANEDKLYFNYTTDSDFSGGTNRSQRCYIKEGTTGILATLQMVYPVGSIYITTVNTNPAQIFGFGTWEKYSGGYVYAAASTISKTNYTGWGTQNHTLTTNEMPSHTHSLHGNTNAYHASGVGYWNYQAIEGYCGGNYVDLYQNGCGANSTGGDQGHSHDIATVDVFLWKRTA